jgi:hypothetical protein
MRKRPPWLASGTVLEHAGRLPDTKAGWRRYLKYLELLATDDEAKKEMVSGKLSRGWCLGGWEFKSELKKETLRRGADVDRERYRGLGPVEVRIEREAAWEEHLRNLAHAAKVDLEKLPAQKSAAPKVLLAAAMKQSTSVSNGWLATRLQMGQPASASQFVRRLMLQERGKRDVRKLLLRAKS